jgi:hypothetical protein
MLSKEQMEQFREAASERLGGGMPKSEQRQLLEHVQYLELQLRSAKAMQQAETERDVLMAFADEVLEWNLESSWGSGASVSLDAIVDRYAGRLTMPTSGEWRPVPVRSLQNLLCLIDPPPVSLPGNKAMVFKNPNAADVLTRISAEIRAMLSATNHATIQPLSTKE